MEFRFTLTIKYEDKLGNTRKVTERVGGDTLSDALQAGLDYWNEFAKTHKKASFESLEKYDLSELAEVVLEALQNRPIEPKNYECKGGVIFHHDHRYGPSYFGRPVENYHIQESNAFSGTN